MLSSKANEISGFLKVQRPLEVKERESEQERDPGVKKKKGVITVEAPLESFVHTRTHTHPHIHNLVHLSF